VGEEKIEYNINRGLLMASGLFFKACLTHSMKENQESVIELSEDSSDGFRLLVDYINYNNRVSPVVADTGVVLAMDAYVLADKYGMFNLQNGLIDRIQSYWWAHGMPPSHFMWIVENGVAEHCPLYKLGLDQLLWSLTLSPRRYCGYKEYDTASTILKAMKVGKPLKNRATHLRRPWMTEIEELFDIPGVEKKVMEALRGARVEDINPMRKAACAYHVHAAEGSEGKGDEGSEDVEDLCASMQKFGVY